jgi:hypothetical protein
MKIINPEKPVLLVSAGVVHPTLSARRRFHTIVHQDALVSATVTSRVENLTLLDGGGFEGVILYFHRRQITDGALGALDRFVSGGGGLLAVHGASASFKKTPRYFDILGGRFVSHGPVGSYTVRRTAAAFSAFGVMEPLAVTDELYIHEYGKDVTVHFSTDTDRGPEPVVWTRRHGKGRVCYVSLGHVAAVMNDRAVRRIMADGLLWTLGHQREGKDA